jgi:hypothetical protein
MAGFLIGVLCAGNFYAKADWRGAAAYRAFLERKSALEAQAQPDSMVAVINFWDPLYRFPALRLLDSQAQLHNLWVYDVIEVASARVFHWRQEFAVNAQARWSRGEQVWLSNRLLADKAIPDASNGARSGNSSVRWMSLRARAVATASCWWPTTSAIWSECGNYPPPLVPTHTSQTWSNEAAHGLVRGYRRDKPA